MWVSSDQRLGLPWPASSPRHMAHCFMRCRLLILGCSSCIYQTCFARPCRNMTWSIIPDHLRQSLELIWVYFFKHWFEKWDASLPAGLFFFVFFCWFSISCTEISSLDHGPSSCKRLFHYWISYERLDWPISILFVGFSN